MVQTQRATLGDLDRYIDYHSIIRKIGSGAAIWDIALAGATLPRTVGCEELDDGARVGASILQHDRDLNQTSLAGTICFNRELLENDGPISMIRICWRSAPDYRLWPRYIWTLVVGTTEPHRGRNHSKGRRKHQLFHHHRPFSCCWRRLSARRLLLKAVKRCHAPSSRWCSSASAAACWPVGPSGAGRETVLQLA